VHRTSWLPAADLGVVDGIPSTKVARTLIDLASLMPRSQLAVALDDALSRGLIIPSYLRRRLTVTGSQGRRGAATLLSLLDQRSADRALAHRKLERLVLALLAGARDLPPFEPHFPVRLLTGGTASVDYAFPNHMVGDEADSYRHHSSHTQWSRDHTRRMGLTELGWTIVPVTYDDAVNHARRTLARLRNTLAVAGACRLSRRQAG
jgi:hypothetical protein